MRRSIKIIVMCVVAIMIIVGIFLSVAPQTLDFRGAVTKIENMGDTTVFYISMSSVGTSYTVVADRNTKISYCHKDDPEITMEDINIGDEIEGDYRLMSKEKIAKFITVQYHK